MRTIKHNARWVSIIFLALACFTLQLVYPEWRSELKAQGYYHNTPPHVAPIGGGIYQIGDLIIIEGQVSDFDG